MMYVIFVEWMIEVIGEFEYVDISKDFCFLWIFFNWIIKCYKLFVNFYGMEDMIEWIVGYFKYVV